MMPAGKVLNFTALLPSNRTYVTYPGSLTTPPCTEGVMWHVLITPQTISLPQVCVCVCAGGEGGEGGRGVHTLARRRIGRAASCSSDPHNGSTLVACSTRIFFLPWVTTSARWASCPRWH